LFNPSILPDDKLCDLIKKNKEANLCLVELMNRHSGVYIKVASQFIGNPYVDVNSLVEDKPYNIYSCAISFDKTRAKFSTFLGNTVRYLALDQIQESKKAQFEQLSPSLYSDNDTSHLVENREDMAVVEEELEKMDERAKDIFTQRYYDSDSISQQTPWKKISEKIGITQWGCILRQRQSNQKIKDKLQQL